MKFIKNKNLQKLFNILGILLLLFLLNQNLDLKIIEFQQLEKRKIFYVFLFMNLRLFIRSILQIEITKILKIEITFLECLKIVSLTRFGNSFGFLKLGSGYKIHYYLKKLNVKFKDYIFVSSLQTLLEYSVNLNFILISAYYLLDSTFLLNNFLVIILIFNFLLLISSAIYKVIKTKHQFVKNLPEIKTKSILKFFLISLFVTIVNIFLSFQIFLLFENNISLEQVNMYYNLGNLINFITITPGNIGFFEYLIISLENLHKINAQAILLSSIFFRIFDYFLGFLYFIFKDKLFKS